VSTVNVMAREVAAKIVFYGPGLSGKTTTLQKIYESVKPQHRGEMMSLPTEADRTLFFDFLPVKVERVGDCSVRLALYTVPGQVFYNATRKLVLQGADGVVFVADSQPEALDSNRESLKNLEENLFEQGIRLERFPLVIQYNKRDIPKALAVSELRAELNPRSVPDFETVAASGRGVLDGLKAITRLVIKDLRAKRVVPSRGPLPNETIPKMSEGSGMDDQLAEQMAHVPQQQQMAAPEPAPVSTLLPIGPAASLAPHSLRDYARAADMAFASQDHVGCVRACQEAVRRALGYTGETSLATQGYLLRIDGADLLQLIALSNKAVIRADDAAFALYVMLQCFVRLRSSPMSEPIED
jgi:signal recognition particle receptor subunit beta